LTEFEGNEIEEDYLELRDGRNNTKTVEIKIINS